MNSDGQRRFFGVQWRRGVGRSCLNVRQRRIQLPIGGLAAGAASAGAHPARHLCRFAAVRGRGSAALRRTWNLGK